MTEDRIMTLHPEVGKKGVNIEQGKYDQVKGAILEALERSEGMTFTQLMETFEKELEGRFEGSVDWYVTTVKLDLERRGMVKREGKSPQVVRLVVEDGR